MAFRKFIFILLTAITVCFAVAPAAFAGEIAESSPVVVDGTEIFFVKVRITSDSIGERARLIADKIVNAAKDPKISVDDIKVAPGSSARVLEIVAGDDMRIAEITAADSNIEGITLDEHAENIAEIIRRSVADYREARRVRHLVVQSVKAFLYTCALVLVFAVLRRISAAYKRYEDRMPDGLKKFRILHVPVARLVSAGMLRRIYEYFGISIIVLSGFAATYCYAFFTLGLFPWTAEWSYLLGSYAVFVFERAGTMALGVLPNILTILAILFASGLLLRFNKFIFDQLKRGKIKIAGFYPDWADTTRRIFKVFVVAFTVIIVYPRIPGAQSAVFQGVSVLLGIVISIGSTTVISNLMAGVAITYTRSFHLGDRVEIGGNVGDIVEKSALSIRMRTVKNEIVTIPNSSILSQPVVNFNSPSKEGALILHLPVSIGYDVKCQRAVELLTEAAEMTPDILSEPRPYVLFAEMGDYAFVYELNAFTRHPEKMPFIYSELNKNIVESLKREGIDPNVPKQVVAKKVK
ncbi:MAG: mechanosensitive ion channel family protein [Defluviitaleaceae bacterium]|nr:mechanosensitive ion channel family protein [Defluviitaleaceae bacterium]